MRQQRKALTIEDSYLFYKEGEELPVSREVYMKVLLRFVELMKEEIIEKGNSFLMPAGLGRLEVDKRKIKWDKKNMKIDWKKTKELGQTIYHTNSHSRNFYYRLYWQKRTAHFLNKGKYRFVPTRGKKGVKALLHNRILEGADYAPRL